MIRTLAMVSVWLNASASVNRPLAQLWQTGWLAGFDDGARQYGQVVDLFISSSPDDEVNGDKPLPVAVMVARSWCWF